MQLPFGRTRVLETQVEHFLDIIIKGILVLKEGIRSYLKDEQEEFENRIEMIRRLENEADDLRKQAEATLYTFSLIPESRGDVLGLLENLDNVIDKCKLVLLRFEVERPGFPKALTDSFLELTDNSIQSVDHVVIAARAFFRDVGQVKDHTAKVDFYESEADRSALKLKRQVFRSDLDLAHKMHLRYFIEEVEALSDMAEHVSERIGIAAIKRSV